MAAARQKPWLARGARRGVGSVAYLTAPYTIVAEVAPALAGAAFPPLSKRMPALGGCPAGVCRLQLAVDGDERNSAAAGVSVLNRGGGPDVCRYTKHDRQQDAGDQRVEQPVGWGVPDHVIHRGSLVGLSNRSTWLDHRTSQSTAACRGWRRMRPTRSQDTL